tara:strand:+ start:2929 stop:3168 length:240 start_codon:yes stop_codon:yes gene_type:complete
MAFKQKYTQEFIDRVHLMKDSFEKSEIAKELNVKVRAISYILDKRKPSVEVKYKKVEEAKKEVDNIWKRIKKNFTFNLK